MSKSVEWIYGIHTCHALLQKHPERILKAACLENRDDKKLQGIVQQLEQLAIPIQRVNRKELDEQLNTQQHQGIAIECKAAQVQNKQYLDSLLAKKSGDVLLLILDGVTDPHNLGACIRSAEAAGADAVIIPKNRAAGLTPTTRKVACGAAEILPIISVTNLAQCLKDLKNQGIWLYGAAGEASSNIYNTKLTGNIAIIMGSEGEGLRRLTREHCDALIHIPMLGSTSSLNVSVATGVCLFEAIRQRS